MPYLILVLILKVVTPDSFFNLNFFKLHLLLLAGLLKLLAYLLLFLDSSLLAYPLNAIDADTNEDSGDNSR
jgi:hypothetical protein